MNERAKERKWSEITKEREGKREGVQKRGRAREREGKREGVQKRGSA